MNNRLTFRVWNGETMVSPDYIDRKGFAHWKENSIPETSDKVMQSTGIKDCHGTLIFEGDIIKWGHIEGAKEYEVRIAKVSISPDIQFDCKNISHPHIFHWGNFFYSGKQTEVIGNVYEHSDLLIH